MVMSWPGEEACVFPSCALPPPPRIIAAPGRQTAICAGSAGGPRVQEHKNAQLAGRIRFFLPFAANGTGIF